MEIFMTHVGIGFDVEGKKNIRVQKTTEVRADPPKPDKVLEVVDKFRDRAFQTRLEYKSSNVPMYQRDVAFLNRYLCATVCLGMAQRSGVMSNLLAAEYSKCVADGKEHRDENGERFYVITVAHHKTVEQFSANIVLDDDLADLFMKYNKYIRQRIMQKTRSTCPCFLIQWDGKQFVKVTDGIRKLQVEAGLPEITSTMARRSFETYNSE